MSALIETRSGNFTLVVAPLSQGGSDDPSIME